MKPSADRMNMSPNKNMSTDAAMPHELNSSTSATTHYLHSGVYIYIYIRSAGAHFRNQDTKILMDNRPSTRSYSMGWLASS